VILGISEDAGWFQVQMADGSADGCHFGDGQASGDLAAIPVALAQQPTDTPFDGHSDAYPDSTDADPDSRPPAATTPSPTTRATITLTPSRTPTATFTPSIAPSPTPGEVGMGSCAVIVEDDFNGNTSPHDWYQEATDRYAVLFENGAYKLQINYLREPVGRQGEARPRVGQPAVTSSRMRASRR
jgi:hypothetical protein